MKKSLISTLLIASFSLIGCGSDSNSSTQPDVKPIPQDTIQGLASLGGAIKGQISLHQATTSDSEKNTRSASALLATDNGEFTIAHADTLRYPVLLKINGVHGVKATEEFSLLLDNTDSRINLSPLTRLIIGRVTGVDANEVFDNFYAYQARFTQHALDNAQQELKAVIEPLLIAANIPANIDVFSAKYSANATDLDSVLSTLHVEYKHDKAIISYLPNSLYRVELPYAESWQNKSLLPHGSDQEQLKQELSLIHKASALLETMILLRDDHDAFNALIAPDAHWFGSPAQALHETYFTILPAENDPTLQRYRDVVLLASQPEQNRYLVGYTTAFEASKTSSVSRDQAWFEYVDGELKFLGDDQPFPTSFYALYKLNAAEADYNWYPAEEFQWIFETTGFLAANDCSKVPLKGDWQWGVDGFIDSLTPVGDIFTGLQHVSVTSPTQQAIKFDKVFRDPKDNTCHLVDSQNQVSGMLDGYRIDPKTDVIKPNQAYTVSFVYTDHQLVKTLYLTQPPEAKPLVAPYMAKMSVINGAQEGFFYQWQRDSHLVEEGDLYVYFADDSASQRITIKKGQTQVSEHLGKDVVRVFHNAFDPYGRIITNYYVSSGADAPLE